MIAVKNDVNALGMNLETLLKIGNEFHERSPTSWEDCVGVWKPRRLHFCGWLELRGTKTSDELCFTILPRHQLVKNRTSGMNQSVFKIRTEENLFYAISEKSLRSVGIEAVRNRVQTVGTVKNTRSTFMIWTWLVGFKTPLGRFAVGSTLN